MKQPDKRPETLCMAPWTHTYLSPQTERRRCCANLCLAPFGDSYTFGHKLSNCQRGSSVLNFYVKCCKQTGIEGKVF